MRIIKTVVLGLAFSMLCTASTLYACQKTGRITVSPLCDASCNVPQAGLKSYVCRGAPGETLVVACSTIQDQFTEVTIAMYNGDPYHDYANIMKKACENDAWDWSFNKNPDDCPKLMKDNSFQVRKGICGAFKDAYSWPNPYTNASVSSTKNEVKSKK